MGWDLALPSVTLDTRWGVPRYDAKTETETYQVAGDQLAPVAYQGTPVARTAERIFHPRVEGSFSRIVRHGDAPTNYWWEVTDKTGRTMIFGGTAATVSASPSGNIATWALREIRDLNGNVARFSYATVADAGVSGSSTNGTNLYPQKITWSGTAASDGKYSVTFVRDRELGEARRADV